MNADALVRERTGQRHPAELTTPIVAGQHFSVFIRVYPWFPLCDYCAAMSGTVDSIEKSCRADGIISVDQCSLLVWTAAMGQGVTRF